MASRARGEGAEHLIEVAERQMRDDLEEEIETSGAGSFHENVDTQKYEKRGECLRRHSSWIRATRADKSSIASSPKEMPWGMM